PGCTELNGASGDRRRAGVIVAAGEEQLSSRAGENDVRKRLLSQGTQHQISTNDRGLGSIIQGSRRESAGAAGQRYILERKDVRIAAIVIDSQFLVVADLQVAHADERVSRRSTQRIHDNKTRSGDLHIISERRVTGGIVADIQFGVAGGIAV